MRVAKLWTLSLLDQEQMDAFMESLDRVYEGCVECTRSDRSVTYCDACQSRTTQLWQMGVLQLED
jgi:hypothetical protein